jgi:hypothetical protein
MHLRPAYHYDPNSVLVFDFRYGSTEDSELLSAFGRGVAMSQLGHDFAVMQAISPSFIPI